MKQKNEKSKPVKKADQDVAKTHEQLQADFDALVTEKVPEPYLMVRRE